MPSRVGAAGVSGDPDLPHRAARRIWSASTSTTYIDDVREGRAREAATAAIPCSTRTKSVVGTLSRYHLLRPRRKRVVLVDHNEMAQAVPGLEQAEILEIIDHHRLADIQTTQSHPYCRNEPVGSTTTIITNDVSGARRHAVAEAWRVMMAGAIVSDTVMFKSPTCTQRDIAAWPSAWPASPTSRSRSWASRSSPPRASDDKTAGGAAASRTSRISTSRATISASARSPALNSAHDPRAQAGVPGYHAARPCRSGTTA